MNQRIPLALAAVLMLAGCSGTAPELGVNNGRLTPCPKTPNCVNSQAEDEKHAIEPIVVAAAPQKTRDRLLKVVAAEKRAEIVRAEKDYIRTTFRSAFFGFVDDVEFYISGQRKDNTVVHVRSASRIGHSDLGVNRKRVERIRKKLLENN
ncbi:MAG: DUF1499 domain-containing protein [Desulfofustis sp.]|jgi:uncharacterized protein (DUF1499 family)